MSKKSKFLLLFILNISLYANEPNFEKYDGVAIILDLESSKETIFGNRADERLNPCSTFKILNSLISLETKVVKDEFETIKWDGIHREYDSWNKNHTIKSAIEVSAVWFYQELSKRVGYENMKKYVDDVDYGNRDVSKDLTNFWLGNGSLKISTREQALFIKKLLQNRTPFSTKNINIVKKIIKLNDKANRDIYGKTGTCNRVGWFIGFEIKNGQTVIFAFNIKGKDANGLVAKKIALDYLEKY